MTVQKCAIKKIIVRLYIVVHLIVSFTPFAVASSVTQLEKNYQIPDYYWRDYVGLIPNDAIQGGTDENGKPTYIGQVYITEAGGITPVTIYHGRNSVSTVANSKEITVERNIKILCTTDQSKFEWTSTKPADMLSDRHLVRGGNQLSESVNIGRVNHNGRLIIGKVFLLPSPNAGLSISDKSETIRFQTYEILTYNNQTDQIPLVIEIDIRYIID